MKCHRPKNLTCKIGSLFFTKVFHVFRGCLTEFIFCCCRREANSKKFQILLPRFQKIAAVGLKRWNIIQSSRKRCSPCPRNRLLAGQTILFFDEANKPKSDKCFQFCVTSVSMSRVEPAGTITVRIDLKSSAQIDLASTQKTTHST